MNIRGKYIKYFKIDSKYEINDIYITFDINKNKFYNLNVIDKNTNDYYILKYDKKFNFISSDLLLNTLKEEIFYNDKIVIPSKYNIVDLTINNNYNKIINIIDLSQINSKKVTIKINSSIDKIIFNNINNNININLDSNVKVDKIEILDNNVNLLEINSNIHDISFIKNIKNICSINNCIVINYKVCNTKKTFNSIVIMNNKLYKNKFYIKEVADLKEFIRKNRPEIDSNNIRELQKIIDYKNLSLDDLIFLKQTIFKLTDDESYEFLGLTKKLNNKR